MERKTPLFIDEVDYLVHDSRMIGTLRDLHDMTGTSIVLLGMDMADKKLARYKPVYDRLSEIVKFKPLSLADVKGIAEQICEIPLSDDAITLIYNEAKGFRGVVKRFYRAEALAKTNSYKEITADILTGRGKS